jgi:hypothetical protein
VFEGREACRFFVQLFAVTRHAASLRVMSALRKSRPTRPVHRTAVPFAAVLAASSTGAALAAVWRFLSLRRRDS